MTWLNPRTWVAGEKPTAAIMNQHIRDNTLALADRIQVVVKPSDESITSATGTTLQNDDDLVFAAVAGQKYAFRVWLVVGTSSSAINMQIGWTFPSGGTLAYGVFGIDPAASSAIASANTPATASATAAGTSFTVGAISGTVGVIVEGSFVCVSSGNVRMQWAQGTSSATSLVVKKGSTLTAIRASV